MTIHERINSKHQFKVYNPSRPAYNVYSPSYNFGEKIQKLKDNWNWTVKCLNSSYIFFV